MASLNAFLHSAFHEPRTRTYRVVQGAVWALIVLSIALLVAEAMLADDSRAREALRQIDRVVLAIFALELFLRVVSFRPPAVKVFKHAQIGQLGVQLRARLGYLLRPMSLIDLLAILAFFPELRGLRALRALRLLRTSRVFRYHNPFAIVMQALEENGLLFAFAFSVLGSATVLGGISMYLVEAKLNPSIDSLIDALWWALVTITTVGFGDITPVTLLGRIVAAVLMVAGLFTLALFAGIVGSSLVSGMLSIREEQFRMSGYVNHIVVCGFDESTHLLLGALVDEVNLNETRVVLIDGHERPRDVPPEFLWVQGDPSKESELDKVRLTHARAVIITGARDMTPQDADARTILVMFTIRSFLKKNPKQLRDRRFPLYVVAEILDSENVDHALTAGADEVIETRKIGYSMIAHAVRFHGTASTMSRVLMSGDDNVYIGQIPDAPAEPIPFGELLVRLQLNKRGGLIVGVRPPSGRELINPPKSYSVKPGTLLIYFAKEPLLDPPG